MAKIYHLENPYLWDCLLIVRRLGYPLDEFKIDNELRCYFRDCFIGKGYPYALKTMETIEHIEVMCDTR